MPKRQHPYTVNFNVQYIKYLFYIQVWRIAVIQRSWDLLWISIVVYIVFAVYEYYICTEHLTFGGFVASQDYFILLRHGKQVDGTEEDILHREAPNHLQAVRMGIEPAQIQQQKTN